MTIMVYQPCIVKTKLISQNVTNKNKLLSATIRVSRGNRFPRFPSFCYRFFIFFPDFPRFWYFWKQNSKIGQNVQMPGNKAQIPLFSKTGPRSFPALRVSSKKQEKFHRFHRFFFRFLDFSEIFFRFLDFLDFIFTVTWTPWLQYISCKATLSVFSTLLFIFDGEQSFPLKLTTITAVIASVIVIETFCHFKCLSTL